MDRNIKNSDIHYIANNGTKYANHSDVHLLDRLFRSKDVPRHSNSPVYPKDRNIYDTFDKTMQDYFGPDAETNPASALKSKRSSSVESEPVTVGVNEIKSIYTPNKSAKPSSKEPYFRGVPGVRMQYNGNTLDPTISYRNKQADYWAVENAMWNWFKEDPESGYEPSLGDDGNDEAFNKFCKMHKQDLIEFITGF